MSQNFHQKCSYLLLQSHKGFHNLSGVVPIEQPLNVSVHSGSRLISDGGAKHGYAEEEDGPSHNMETSYNSGISPPQMSKQKGMYTDVDLSTSGVQPPIPEDSRVQYQEIDIRATHVS